MYKMDNDSFHYFSKMPPELRRHIWKYCLPYRIAEEDIPDFLLDGEESRQACYAPYMTCQNAQPPVIALVNRESRQVVLEQGHRVDPQSSSPPYLIWVQPHRDVLHCNWTRLRYAIQGIDWDAPSPMPMFLWRAEDLGMQPSVVAEIIHPFSLQALLAGDAASESPSIPYERPYGDEMGDIADCAFLAGDPNNKGLGATMAAISLHISREAALRSGLFGLLSDAPVQMVDVGDEARLKDFHALFKENASEKEPAVEALFKTFLSPRFRAAVELWTRQAEWLILGRLWYTARDEKVDILGPDWDSVWVPKLTNRLTIRMEKHSPNKEHPWMKRAMKIAYKLQPRIMVRYCTNECYIKK